MHGEVFARIDWNVSEVLKEVLVKTWLIGGHSTFLCPGSLKRRVDLRVSELVRLFSVVDKKYLQHLIVYKKTLKQWNNRLALWRNLSSNIESNIDVWTKKLVIHGSFLICNRAEESKRKVTVVGPHRDDITTCLDDHDVRQYVPQGQHKTILLSLKSVEHEFISGLKGFQPAILLDDLFALLDKGTDFRVFEDNTWVWAILYNG